MNSYEEIKHLLENKEFKYALLAAFSNSLKFKLTSEITNQKETSAIETEIDLLKGLSTKASNVEVLSRDNHLIKFHTKQLENVHELWNQNRQILVTIFQVLAGKEISNLDDLKKTFLSSNSSTVIERKESKEVDNIVDLMLEEHEENYQVEVENKEENWPDESEELSPEIDDDSNLETTEDTIDENENMVISTEQQQQAEESWEEFMDDLSAEEEAVTEEVVVDDVSPEGEIDEDWSEWLNEDDSNVDVDNQEEEELIDWSKQEEVIK